MLCELADVVAAIEKEELVPFFQPVVELRTGKLKGFEVLARWCHPKHGCILPSNFISLAEDHGLIDELTRQVSRKAFLSSNLLPGDLTLAVNVSPIQMRESSLPRKLEEYAAGTGFSMSCLIVEITESALYNNVKCAQQVANDLKAMGCRLALDDFGTGYSSLRHLQSLNFDELKIDRSFVSDITSKRGSRKIVAAIIGLGQSLDLGMIAEGVETEEQADMLIWLGCQQAQGWRYGRPEAAEVIPRTIAAEPISSIEALTTPGDDWATATLEALPNLRLAQLQAIYDGAPVGLCFLDNKLRYVNLNQRLADMNGKPARSHIGRYVQEMYPEWFPIYEPYLRRALKGEAISGTTIRRPGANSEEGGVDLLASYQPAWDEADDVVGISISILDITEHRQPAETLGGARLPMTHFEVNPEVPWVMDAEGNDLQVSSRWVQATPLGKDLTRNLRWLEALHSDDVEPTIKAMKHALRTGKPIDVEYRILSVEGEWRWMRSRGSPRFSPSGQITRWYGSVEDIHDQKPQDEKSAGASEDETRREYDAVAKGIVVSEALQSSIVESGPSKDADQRRS